MNRTLFLLFIVVGTTVMSEANSAEILVVNDTFTRSGALIGSVTDTGQTWTGVAPTSNANGSQLAVVGSSPSFATISGLTFLPDATYRLQVDVNITSGGSQWLGIGFSRPTSSNAADDTNGFILRRSNPEIETRVTASSATKVAHAVANTFPDTLEVFLETGPTLSSSMLSWFLNGSPLRIDEAVDVTGIDGIFLANVSPFFGSPVSGTYDNLELWVQTQVVPEPNTAAIFVFGTVALGLCSRRKR